MERAQPEREPKGQSVTGLFRINMSGVKMELSPDGKAQVAGDEPRFAVKDVELVPTREGWDEFARRLAVHLTGVEGELYRGDRLYAVAESTLDELVDGLQPGEIRLISREEYSEAFIRKYGGGIIGPLFL